MIVYLLNCYTMKFRHLNPILYSANVVKSIEYYTNILGFESHWNWGDPPTFGGVGKDGAEIFFCEKGQGNPGTWFSIFVDDVDAYYEQIKAAGARIINAPENYEWGMREMLVEDPDGHRIRFGCGVHVSDAIQETTLPPTIKIIKRSPTAKEHLDLITAVGWSSSISDAQEAMVLAAPVFSVVAEDTASGQTIGCALLLGDNVSFYYIKDVMVHPVFQHKRVGTAMMQEITSWLDANAVADALVGLYTGDSLRHFYEKFGFKSAYGMSRRISHRK